MTKKNKTLGLALGSGGVRGLTHVGILDYLIEHNLTPDYIAGTSIGGIVGAFYSYFGGTAELKELMFENRSQMISSLMDPTWFGGLVAGRKVRKLFKHYFGNATFADLKIPLTLVAADLNTGEQVLLNQGELVPAIYATMAIPGMFSPLDYQGRQLVDGGVANPVPDEVVREMGATTVLAVNVDNYNLNIKPEKKYRGLRSVAFRSALIMLHHLAQHSVTTADYLLEPNIEEDVVVGIPYLFKPATVTKLITEGYKTAHTGLKDFTIGS